MQRSPLHTIVAIYAAAVIEAFVSKMQSTEKHPCLVLLLKLVSMLESFPKRITPTGEGSRGKFMNQLAHKLDAFLHSRRSPAYHRRKTLETQNYRRESARWYTKR